jgi:hypothetical protein
LTRHEKTPVVVMTEIGKQDLTRQKFNCWPKEGDTEETGDSLSYTFLAGYPQMVDVKEIIVSFTAIEKMNDKGGIKNKRMNWKLIE